MPATAFEKESSSCFNDIVHVFASFDTLSSWRPCTCSLTKSQASVLLSGSQMLLLTMFHILTGLLRPTNHSLLHDHVYCRDILYRLTCLIWLTFYSTPFACLIRTLVGSVLTYLICSLACWKCYLFSRPSTSRRGLDRSQ
ncbi:uncharacterized protein SCHCODRAFT_01256951 [Schizophyllum commune H4-8]|uniref:uncharacterized protein n=1 Tax=Schizophyllum commune (strain H4-8 / FGSC 9210) TaxID=578458 RepID=UPI00215F03A0|nr:uncharacterized protein SCHCODRAFT_01256951 [Schizophyllum commune H4-8]KAI5885518.1 hypothetical protein SCHCODRAFT_01256951 [Schizophyllum commune H4-8]